MRTPQDFCRQIIRCVSTALFNSVAQGTGLRPDANENITTLAQDWYEEIRNGVYDDCISTAQSFADSGLVEWKCRPVQLVNTLRKKRNEA